jgi:hypothetical protein
MIDNDPTGAQLYAESRPIQEESRRIYERSLGNPAHRARPGTIQVRNAAAFWFWVAGIDDLLKIELKKIDGAWTHVPWYRLGHPATQFAAAKRQADGP